MTRTRVAFFGGLVALLVVGVAGYWLGARSASETVAATHAAVPQPPRDRDADLARQRAWHEAANALTRVAKEGVDTAQDNTPSTPAAAASAESALADPEDEVAPAPAEEGKPVTATEERDKAVARVRASGPAENRLFERARSVGTLWTTLAKKHDWPAQVSDWECHVAGCFATVVQKTETEIEDLTNELTRHDEFRGWEGPKMRSGPIKRADGTTEATWILYSNDEQARGR